MAEVEHHSGTRAKGAKRGPDGAALGRFEVIGCENGWIVCEVTAGNFDGPRYVARDPAGIAEAIEAGGGAMSAAQSEILAAVCRAADGGAPLRAKQLLGFDAGAVRRLFDSGAIERAELRLGAAVETVILPAPAPEADEEAWTGEELQYLEVAYCGGVSFGEMARALKRPGGAILQEAWRRKWVRRRDPGGDRWGSEIPAWRIARLRHVLDEAERRGANPLDGGEDLRAHRALRRRFEAGRRDGTPTRHFCRWTEAETAALKEHRREGRTAHWIARRLKRTFSAVATMITELDLGRDVSWREDEDRILLAGVERGLTNREVAAMLPGRSDLAVKARAHALVGPRGFEPWSAEEEAALRAAYERGENIRAFAPSIGRTPCGARWVARRLGLVHPGAVRPYGAAEDRRIAEGWKRRERPAEIAEDLGRPLAGIYNRAFKLGLTGKGPGHYHRNIRRFEVAYIRARVAQGWTGEEIAGRLKRTKASVYKIAEKNGIRWTRSGPRPADGAGTVAEASTGRRAALVRSGAGRLELREAGP